MGKATREAFLATPEGTLIAKEPARPREPVRVKVRKENCDNGKIDQPSESRGLWRQQLKEAFGTVSDDFIDLSLGQLLLATRPHGSAVSEMALNAALAHIESWAPKNVMEASLAVQAACTHAAAMAVMSKAAGAHGPARHVASLSLAGARLMQTALQQAEFHRRLHRPNVQSIRVEHVHLHEGAQAVIGTVTR